MPLLTLITPTGGRPEAFALCERFMSRQTFIDWEWIVVDDCLPLTDCTMGQTVLHPKPLWEAGGGSTQNRNLLLALTRVQSDFVAVIEDDDYYGPEYLETLCGHLKEVVIFGETPSRYYNVRHRMCRSMAANRHASLCQTGFRVELTPMVQEACQLNRETDVFLWSRIHAEHVSSRLCVGNHVVGIKGMPGRGGVGMGHYPQTRPSRWTDDPQLRVLRDWIGEDSKLYTDYYARNSA